MICIILNAFTQKNLILQNNKYEEEEEEEVFIQP